VHGRAGLCVGGRLVRAQQVEQVGRVAQDQAQVLRQPRVRAGPVHQRVHQLQQPEQRLAVQAAQLLAKVCAPAVVACRAHGQAGRQHNGVQWSHRVAWRTMTSSSGVRPTTGTGVAL